MFFFTNKREHPYLHKIHFLVFPTVCFSLFCTNLLGCSSLSGNIRRWIWSKSKWKSQNPPPLQYSFACEGETFCYRFIQAKKVEVPDIVMAIHPHLEGEFWGPTVDLLLDENVVTGVVDSLWCKFEYSLYFAPLSVHSVQWGTLQASPWEVGLRICQVYFQGDLLSNSLPRK